MKLLSHYPHIDISIDFFHGFPGKLSVMHVLHHEYVENILHVQCSLSSTPLDSSCYGFHVYSK